MKITEIAFTGYPVTDMARARRFYEGVLGLSVSRVWGDKENPQWVEDFPGAIAELKSAGVKFFWPPQESPGCHMAGVLDPDENRVVIHHRKASA